MCQGEFVNVRVCVPALEASVQSKIQCFYFLVDLCGDVCLCTQNRITGKDGGPGFCVVCVCAYLCVCVCKSACSDVLK